MPNKNKQNNNPIIDDIDLIIDEDDTEEEALEEELAPDIAQALKPQKNVKVTTDIDYIPETDLKGIGMEDEEDEEEGVF